MRMREVLTDTVDCLICGNETPVENALQVASHDEFARYQTFVCKGYCERQWYVDKAEYEIYDILVEPQVL